MLRYVHKRDSCCDGENFKGFKEQHREMTGEAVAATILENLEELGLNCEYL